ncbi:hypothetical protein [Desulfitobacterium sp.]|nr:hypothetical protein [Desulfitobacterium sp.]HVJ47507.1 hypothetical protein [Desulfitobacterium sp.]
MIQKLCPHCLQISYSSYDNPEWICPYCGKEIRNERNEENE